MISFVKYTKSSARRGNDGSTWAIPHDTDYRVLLHGGWGSSIVNGSLADLLVDERTGQDRKHL